MSLHIPCVIVCLGKISLSHSIQKNTKIFTFYALGFHSRTFNLSAYIYIYKCIYFFLLNILECACACTSLQNIENVFQFRESATVTDYPANSVLRTIPCKINANNFRIYKNCIYVYMGIYTHIFSHGRDAPVSSNIHELECSRRNNFFFPFTILCAHAMNRNLIACLL